MRLEIVLRLVSVGLDKLWYGGTLRLLTTCLSRRHRHQPRLLPHLREHQLWHPTSHLMLTRTNRRLVELK